VYADSSGRAGASIMDAVVAGEIDLAVVWGPQAGYYARTSPVDLALVPVQPEIDLPFLPFVFDVSMAVRRGDTLLRDRLDEALVHRAAAIDTVLDRYGIPRLRWSALAARQGVP